GQRKSSRSVRVSPSGRNFWVRSNRRPQMTSASMSQRTRFDAAMQRANRSLVVASISHSFSARAAGWPQLPRMLVDRLRRRVSARGKVVEAAWFADNRHATPHVCRRTAATEIAVLDIRVLGTFEVIRDGAAAALPPSRKTRALLAYLALPRCPPRREQLCEMRWEVPDDPRGSLRWSLSKIRALVDEPAVARLIADRHSVELRTEPGEIDFLAARVCAEDTTAATSDLAAAA